MFRLDGKTAFVSGASQGIGAEIARRLAERGARVVLAARSTSKLEGLAEELAASGAEALPFALDLADLEAVEARFKELPEEFSQVDILVNNAGITDDNLFLRMKLEQWERVLRTNLSGTFALTRAAVRGMLRQRSGRIVTVSSVVGLMGNMGQANYAASKAGLIGFSKSLAKEFGRRGITVNVVAPGFVETAMTEVLSDEVRQQMASQIALGRFGTAADVAAAVAFLASDEAGYITGEVINVSGGLYM
ncbi:MAG: 3-oxoacyl-[acyl-carrier-protein] reductase [Acidobacteria bacterium]|nr:MAG: 3-oxoacyl-[acyl-carrier-protein] reductase [Acidobacteriota bacterium]REK08684.1 MAG: 3-oxoacyl-[acyl-carrier-protein] reductase [Acidobacteriota bacterium]